MSSVIYLISRVFFYILFSIGLSLVLSKCGIKKIWAYIPGFRNYKLAECVDMKDDGVLLLYFSLADFFVSLFIAALELFPDSIDSSVLVMVKIIEFIVLICIAVYEFRVLLGLCKLFRASKKWIPVWMFFRSMAALYFGFSKKLQPEYRIVDKYKTTYLGTDCETLESGLTINIKSRTTGSALRKKTLLQDIHMNIVPGRMVLLLGGSGAGKTTFINAITGYEKADASIILNGKDVYKDFEKMKYEIGFVPQQDLIRYSDTVYHTLDDAAYLRLPSDVNKAERKKRVDEVLDIFGLTPVKDNTVGKQSGGQKKRISIASEFISDPSLYVLDEPDSGLDGILAKELMKRLHDISRQGKIVMVITHSPDRVLECFDDVIVLAKDENHTGRLVYYGPVEEAKSFFGKDSMEDIVKCINREEEGGDGRADEFLAKFSKLGGSANE